MQETNKFHYLLSYLFTSSATRWMGNNTRASTGGARLQQNGRSEHRTGSSTGGGVGVGSGTRRTGSSAGGGTGFGVGSGTRLGHTSTLNNSQYTDGRHLPSTTNDHQPVCDYNTLSSWFGFCGTVLSWFESYLSSQSFRVKCANHLSSLYSSSCGVPQGSVLGPLLFIMYTTPLSTLNSSLSLNHHLYADDTQLFFSFHPPDFYSNITNLQNALQQMTANL